MADAERHFSLGPMTERQILARRLTSPDGGNREKLLLDFSVGKLDENENDKSAV